MEYPPVLTKRDMVRRYIAGEFGNRSPTWNTIQEFYDEYRKVKGLVHLRNRVAAGTTHYNLEPEDAFMAWLATDKPEDWYCSAMCPTEKTIFQGELRRDEQGLCLYYSGLAKPMREALAISSLHVTRLTAKLALQYHMCPNSYDWTMTLLDRYPGHVIEFSTFSEPWGTIPGYNTVWWEIRMY